MKLFSSTLAIVLATTLFTQAQSKRDLSITVKDSVIEKRDTVPDKPVITYHSITVDGKSISYKATTGYMPMRDANDKLLAKIFYVAYPDTNRGAAN
jgi:carboxypeptidase C (cathepsin A)